MSYSVVSEKSSDELVDAVNELIEEQGKEMQHAPEQDGRKAKR